MAEVYCFFCENCGNETLAYDPLNRCPYCHAEQEHFQFLARKKGEVQDEFRGIIEKARANWMENGRHKKGNIKRKKAHVAK